MSSPLCSFPCLALQKLKKKLFLGQATVENKWLPHYMMAHVLGKSPQGNVDGLPPPPRSTPRLRQCTSIFHSPLRKAVEIFAQTVIGMQSRVEEMEGRGHFEVALSVPTSLDEDDTLATPSISPTTKSWRVRKVENRRRPSLSLPTLGVAQVPKN